MTSLNASGPGSLNAACQTRGPRIVVFEVSGVIRGDIAVTEPYITQLSSVDNAVLDHLSLSWTEDETIDLWAQSTNITVQWCTLEESSLTGKLDVPVGAGPCRMFPAGRSNEADHCGSKGRNRLLGPPRAEGLARRVDPDGDPKRCGP